jgi:hypothetical protein
MKDKFAVFCLMVCFTVLVSCNREKEKEESIPVLDIESGLKNMTMMNLGEIKSKIRYVRLETNENCLVTNQINNVFIEDNKIFIYDNEPFLKVFDAGTGNYLYNIGGRGQAYGELPYLSHVHINAKEKMVILAWQEYRYMYDFEGNCLSRMNVPVLPTDSTEAVSYNVILLDKNLYAAGVKSYQDHQMNASVIFDERRNVINTLTSYNDYVQHPVIKTWSPYEQLGFYYPCIDRIHFFRGVCDTVYEYNPASYNFEPYVCFNFGKHRSAHNAHWSNENKDVIKVIMLSENNQYIFIDFETTNASPEPFEKLVWRNGWIKITDKSVYAVYDKTNAIFYFLYQPIPGMKGLKNNVDNGMPFWPRNISSNNEFIDCRQAFKFLECADKLLDPGELVVNLMKDMNEDDNPIIIIAY